MWFGVFLSASAVLGSLAAQQPGELYAEALRQFARGERADAVRTLESVAARHPAFDRTYSRLATALPSADARAVFEKMIASGNRHACLGLVILDRNSKLYDRAAAEAERCSESIPNYFRLHTEWAIAADSKKRIPAFLEVIQRRLRVSPDSAGLHFSIAWGNYYLAAASKREWWAARQAFESARGLAPEEPEIDLALLNLLTETGDWRNAVTVARSLYERARRDADLDLENRGACRLAQAMIFSEQDLPGAVGLLQQAIEKDRPFGIPRRELFCREQLGAGFSKLGDMEKELTERQNTLALSRSLRDPAAESRQIGNLGRLYRIRGDHARGLEMYLESVRLAAGHGQHDIVARHAVNAAQAHLELGETGDALAMLSRGLRAAQEFNQPALEASLNSDAAEILSGVGRPSEALEASARALSLATEAKNQAEIFRARRLKGELLLRADRTKEAEQDLEAAAALASHLADPRRQAELEAALGDLRLRRRQWPEASAHYRSSLDFARASSAEPLAARALEGLFEASAGEGELESSLDTARRAIASVEGVRARLLSADQRMGFLARRATLYRRAAAVALALKRAAEAAQLAELGRARAHLDLLTETQAGLDIALSGTGRAEEQRLRRELEDAEGRMTPGNRAAAEEARQAYARYDSFLKKIERQQTDEEKLPLGRPATLAQIQAVLPASTALLHYTLLEQDAFLLVITSHTIEPVRLGPAAPLNADVNRLREWLAKRPSQLGQLPFLELSHSLYRRLVAPATTLLGGRRRLIVIPDGILHYLPFQVLTSAPASSVAQAPFLIRTYSIHYAPSASVLVELRQWQRQREPAQLLLAIGDPDYAGRYPRLTFSAQEVNGIARLYPAASRTVLLHSAAREDSLASAGDLSRYRILHFAVHGYLNEQMPNFSGLVMTQSKGSDGVLRVHEILRRNLQADLVVLSACETALGRQVNGEGLLGLTRAFLARGSRSVVASLWRVDDQSTAALMTVYHQKLRGGRLDRAEALRQAQLAMLDGSTAHPFYWAGFVFSGGAD